MSEIVTEELYRNEKMKRKRVQASFLLKCVTLAASVGLFLLVFKLFTFTFFTLGALIFLALFWFIGIEFGIVPEYFERILEKRAEGSPKPISSIWFVDLDPQATDEMRTFDQETKDNPTLR